MAHANEWNVRVHRNGDSEWLGTVFGKDESEARHAALYEFADQIGEDDFDVSPR